MCFSATVSLAAAAVIGAIGVTVMARAQDRGELPLASLPLFFAVQQLIEGGLWLTLPLAPESAVTSWLTHAFLAFALVFWPLFAPFAALSAEREPARRRLMITVWALGACVAAYFLWQIGSEPHDARIAGGHVVYEVGATPVTMGLVYLVATTFALLLSSHRAVVAFGAVVFVGSVITYFAYAEALISVWCFFAALGSVVIALHFERARAKRRIAAAALAVVKGE